MLVLTRTKGERILIGDRVVVTVVECRGGRVRLGFEAPETIAIYRAEVLNDYQPAGPPPQDPQTPMPAPKG